MGKQPSSTRGTETALYKEKRGNNTAILQHKDAYGRSGIRHPTACWRRFLLERCFYKFWRCACQLYLCLCLCSVVGSGGGSGSGDCHRGCSTRVLSCRSLGFVGTAPDLSVVPAFQSAVTNALHAHPPFTGRHRAVLEYRQCSPYTTVAF